MRIVFRNLSDFRPRACCTYKTSIFYFNRRYTLQLSPPKKRKAVGVQQIKLAFRFTKLSSTNSSDPKTHSINEV